MSFLNRLLGRRRAPKDRIRVCMECGMPLAQHKEWCAVLREQVERSRRTGSAPGAPAPASNDS